MPPRRRGAAPPPNPWTHLDAQGRHLPGVIAEAPLADDGSVDDDSMLQALTEVGIYRQDSVLWTIVDRKAPLVGVPAHRRELLELAREAVSGEVEEQSKVVANGSTSET